MNNEHLNTGDFVLNGGLIGNFEGLYKSINDPWNQSREDHILDSRRQISINFCLRASKLYGSARILEVGCGFGFLTEQLRKIGFETLGTDISETAIMKALSINPQSNFKFPLITIFTY